jgi:CHAT domain-containing protein
MPSLSFVEQLLQASPEERAVLIAALPSSVGETEVNILAEQAYVASEMNPTESMRIAEIALELADALGQMRARALALRARARALWPQAKWADALASFEEGARAAEEAGDTLLAAQISVASTATLAHLGRYDEAIQLASSLEERLRELGAEEDAAKVVANAGNIHWQREDYVQAKACWERALRYFEDKGQQVPVARLRMNIANVLTHLNELAEALRMYQSARKPLEEAGMDPLLAGLDGNIAFHQFMAGQYTEALQAYSRARQKFEVLNLPKDIAQCDRETADVYLELNLIPEAQETFERVIPTFNELHLTGESARSEMGLAITFASQNREAEAMQALDRAEQSFQREGNGIGVAQVKLRRSEWRRRLHVGERSDTQEGQAESRRVRRESLSALRTFRRYGLKIGEAQARLQLAEMRVSQHGSPVRSLRVLAKEAEQSSFVTLLWRIEAALARAHMNVGRRRAALIHYRKAVEAVERVRMLLYGDDFRVAFLQDKMRLYEELLALLLDYGTPEALMEGFQLAERSKSRTLLELLASPLQSRQIDTPERQALVQRLEELRAQLNWDYARVQQLDGSSVRLPVADATVTSHLPHVEKEYLRAHRQLQLASVDVDETYMPSGLRVQDIQALLEDDEQLVEYVTARDEVLAFVVDRKQFWSVRCLASRAEVEEQVDRLRFQWSKFGPAGFETLYADQVSACTQRVLRALYDMLFEPLESLLTASKLTIVPHGILHGIPFHALYDGEQYALDRWECVYAPSGAVWRACRLQTEPTAERSIVVGVSDPGIAHVRDEVAALQRLLPNAEVYQDEAATLAAIPTDASYRYIHFATHAIFRKDNPLFSGLQLSDGWLIAHDLYRRRLECSLATLSACRTGVSSVVPGDELLGLVRGFLCAGARAVMVSLWAAHDAATAELMQIFYTRLSEGMNRGAALRTAQQEIRKRFPHPYYWAAFALVGAR